MNCPQRLKNTASRFSMPCASSSSCTPSAASSRMACGSKVMPTPISRMSGAPSYTVHSTPSRCRPSASASPPMPPPTIAMFIVTGALFGLDALRLDQLRPALGIALDESPELLGRTGRRVHALRLESRAHLGRRQDVLELAIQARHQLRRGAGRREDAVP